MINFTFNHDSMISVVLRNSIFFSTVSSLVCRTWLLVGELYLRLGQVDAAELCANEARQVKK